MSYPRSPDAYPTTFAIAFEEGLAHRRLEIPCETHKRARGLRAHMNAYLRALERAGREEATRFRALSLTVPKTDPPMLALVHRDDLAAGSEVGAALATLRRQQEAAQVVEPAIKPEPLPQPDEVVQPSLDDALKSMGYTSE